MGEEHDSDAGPTVSRGNPRGKPKRNQLETELVGVRGGGPRSKQVSVSGGTCSENQAWSAVALAGDQWLCARKESALQLQFEAAWQHPDVRLASTPSAACGDISR